ncbi:MAG: carboxypeptidase regulatory-like domain-containing protein [Bacteroidales bacterium]|nr:carboxypeptidase regulatory-like domain-containing protein [Bacteroidales bacterium]
MKKILLSLLILAGWATTGFGAYRPYRPETPSRQYGDRKILVFLYKTGGVSDWDVVKQYYGNDYNRYYSEMLNEEGWQHTPWESNVQIPGYWNGNAWVKTYTTRVKPFASVRDYFIENSMGKYNPQFDVYGPVTIPDETFRAGDDAVVAECYNQLKSQFDIGDYDTDDDGIVDYVIFSRIGGSNGYNTTLNVELGGKSVRKAAAVDAYFQGDFCHEFGHYLGFMDLYNPDPKGDMTDLPGSYCLMGTGNANHPNGTPPYLTTMERYYMGWLDEFKTIDKSGTYTLGPLSSNDAYVIKTSNEGEFFIIEYRPFERWDRYIHACGLIVYHVDQSRRVIDGITALDWWKTKKCINVNSRNYMLYTVVHDNADDGTWTFPGKNNVKDLALSDGDGNYIGVTLKDMGFGGDKAWFRAEIEYSVYGRVLDVSGKPMEGIAVSLTTSDGQQFSTNSDASGNYKFPLDDSVAGSSVNVSVSLPGYMPVSESLEISSIATRYDIVLRQRGEGVPHNMQKYDESGSSTTFRFSGQYGGTAAMLYTASDIYNAGLVGAKLTSISFFAGYGNNRGYVSNIYAVVYFDNEPVLVKDVTRSYSPTEWVSVDVSSDGIVLPYGKKVYIGFAMKANCPADSGWWPSVTAYKGSQNNGGGYFVNDIVGGEINSWSSSTYEYAITATAVAAPAAVTPSDFGIAWIEFADDGNLYAHPAAGKTVADELWDDSSETLWKCTLVYTDGTSEDIWFDLTPYL